MGLVALTDVEAWLGLADGCQDEPLLGRLIAAASGFAETYCGRVFEQASVTEVRDGNGQIAMLPQNSPVASVASVTVGDTAIPAATATDTTSQGFFLIGNVINLRGYAFTRGRNNVVLAYTAGYATVPDDLQQAVIDLVAQRYQERGRIGLRSLSQAGETTSYLVADAPPQVKAVLDRYKRVVPL